MPDFLALPWQDWLEWAATAGLNVLLQSTVLLVIGTSAAGLARGRGAAVQAAILRATLISVVLCPALAAMLGLAGVQGITVRLPNRVHETRPSVQESATQATAVREPRRDEALERPTAPPVAEKSPPTTFEAPDLLLTVEVQSAPNNQGGTPKSEAPSPPLPRVSTHVGTAHPERPSSVPTFAYAAILALWVGTTVLLLGRLIWAHLSIAVARRRAERGPEALVAEVAAMAARWGVRPPDVRMAKAIHSPCLVGVWRPVILLPRVDEAPNAAATREVLLHELAHLARRDCAWSLVAWIAVALVPLQPLLWRLARRIEDLSDDVADDFVLEHAPDRHAYARQLADLAERFKPSRAETVAGLGAVSLRSGLGRRVQRILDTTRALSLRTGVRIAVTVAVLAIVAATVTSLVAVRKPQSWVRDVTPDLKVELLGITAGAESDYQWWSPDGTPLTKSPCPPFDKLLFPSLRD